MNAETAPTEGKDTGAAIPVAWNDAQTPKGVTVSWFNLGYRYLDADGTWKQAFSAHTGSARPGRVLGIIGPGGSGRSSLIKSLCGRAVVDRSHEVQGTVFVDGVVLTDRYSQLLSFAQQEDFSALHDLLTPMEQLTTAHSLMCGSSLSNATAAARELLTKLMISEAHGNMPHAAIGMQKAKQAVVVANELIAAPFVLLLDEVTTGLETTHALAMGATLREYARSKNRTVVATFDNIPRDLFDCLDDVLLLTRDGRVAYHGPRTELAVHFEEYLHSQKPGAADYLELMEQEQPALDAMLAKLDAKERRELAGVEATCIEALKAPQTESAVLDERLAEQPRANIALAFAFLMLRSWRLMVRNPANTVGRFILNTYIALVLGLIFYQVSLGDTGVQQRQSVMFFMTMTGFIGNSANALALAQSQHAAFTREMERYMYQPVVLSLSRFFTDLLPLMFHNTYYIGIIYFMVGLTPSGFLQSWGVIIALAWLGNSWGHALAAVAPDLAVLLLALFVVPMMLVGGPFVNSPQLDWTNFKNVSTIHFGFEGFVLSEFKNIPQLCPNGTFCRFTNGAAVLNYLNMVYSWDTVNWMIGAMLLYNLGCRVIAVVGLYFQAWRSRIRFGFERNSQSTTVSSPISK